VFTSAHRRLAIACLTATRRWHEDRNDRLVRGRAMLKTGVACLGALLMTSAAFATLPNDEMNKLRGSAAVLTGLRTAPDQGIPDTLWARAQCVLVIPTMKKAAFIIGGEFGSGVMSCRRGDGWSAPIFMQLAKGSWGLQAGAQTVDLVLLVMNKQGVDKLLEDKVSLGADASVAAGPVGRAANAATDAQLHTEMLAYSRTRGLFAGIDLSGGVLRPDNAANVRAYGPGVTPRQILEGSGHVTTPPGAQGFLSALGSDMQATAGRQ
jgi:lipid-binding SYLF domain-containing protein